MKRPKSTADLKMFQSNLQYGSLTSPGSRQMLRSQAFPSIADPQSAKAVLFGRIIMDAKTTIQKQHNDIRNFLMEEKQKQDKNEKFFTKIKKVEEMIQNNLKEKKELAQMNDLKRQMKRERVQKLELEREKQFAQERKRLSQNAIEFERKEREREQLRRQQAMEKAEREREKQRQIEEKRTQLEEKEQRKLFEKLDKLEKIVEERGNKHQDFINHKKLLAKEYTDHILERLELLKIKDIVRTIEVENSYLTKVEKINKVREDRQTKDVEGLSVLKSKNGKRFERTFHNKQLQSLDEKKRFKDKEKQMRQSTDNLLAKQEEKQYKLMSDKEKEYYQKKIIIDKNLEKEKKKLEWKKVKILAKEQLNDERVQFIKYEEDTIKKSLAELTIQQQLERDRLIRTMNRIRNADFKDAKVINYIQETIPDINVGKIFEKPKVEKNEDEQ